MRILHLISQRPDSTGSGTYLQAMVREGTASGHESLVVAGIQAGQPAEIDCPIEYVTFGGGDVTYPIVGMSDVMPYESRRFRDLSDGEIDEYEAAFSRAMRAVVGEFQPDIIHSHHLWIVTSLARRQFPGIPIVATCHGSDLRQFQTCRHLQERVLTGCRGLNGVMALSDAQREDILDLYDLPPERVIVVGAGYDAERFTLGEKGEADPVRIVYAGKLSRAKGVPWMLRALSTIDRPAWKLDLVGGGSGEEADECRRLAGRMEARVTAHGPLPQDRLAEIMRGCHLLVLPSFYEGLPLIVLEGLASGCRIVATELPGTRELLGDAGVDFVTLVEPPRLHDLDRPYEEDERPFERELADALRGQMEAARGSPEIDVSPIRERMASYTWTGVFQRVQGVYARVLGRGRGWSPMWPGVTAGLTILLAVCMALLLGLSLFISPVQNLSTPNRTVVHVMERELDLAEAGAELPFWIRWACMTETPKEVRRAAAVAYDEVIELDAGNRGDVPLDVVIAHRQEVDRSRWVDRDLVASLLIFGVGILVILGAGVAIVGVWLWRSRRWPLLGSGQGISPWDPWTGYGVGVRAAMMAAGVFVVLTILPIPVLNLWMTLCASLGLVWLMRGYLLRPWGLTFRDAFGLRFPRGVGLLAFVSVAAFTVATAGQMVIGVVTGLIGLEGHWGEIIVEDLLFRGPGPVLLLSMDAIVWAPLFEEIGFRGLVYTTMRSRLGVTPAILGSAAIFAIIHFYSLPGLISVFWLGVVMAVLYEKTRSLWPCIIFHALWNLSSIGALILFYR